MGRAVKRWAFVFLFVTGCSTAPIADVLDYFKPGRIEPAKTAPYGGVCVPKQIGPPDGAIVVPAQPATGPALPATNLPPPVAPLPSPQGTPLPPPDFGAPGLPSGGIPPP
jgi:hypothetical protein